MARLDDIQARSDFRLVEVEGRLGLRQECEPDSMAVFVDFQAPALNYRLSSALKQQGLSKAVGIKGSTRPSVLDATAGFAKDAFLLASQGCRVHMLERDEFVHALLEDGIKRGRESEDESVLQGLESLSLQYANFLDADLSGSDWDVVMLDPMFPESKKSARVKKDMFALQGLLGASTDAEQMWERACVIAKKRVVVKRSKNAPTLGRRKPDFQYKGSSSRFDVYLTPK